MQTAVNEECPSSKHNCRDLPEPLPHQPGPVAGWGPKDAFRNPPAGAALRRPGAWVAHSASGWNVGYGPESTRARLGSQRLWQRHTGFLDNQTEDSLWFIIYHFKLSFSDLIRERDFRKSPPFQAWEPLTPATASPGWCCSNLPQIRLSTELLEFQAGRSDSS